MSAHPSSTVVDVVVVGGGPGGATAAAYLAMLGHDVLVLEKERFPRDKVCGDGLTPRVVQELLDLGLTDEAHGRRASRAGGAAAQRAVKRLRERSAPLVRQKHPVFPRVKRGLEPHTRTRAPRRHPSTPPTKGAQQQRRAPVFHGICLKCCVKSGRRCRTHARGPTPRGPSAPVLQRGCRALLAPVLGCDAKRSVSLPSFMCRHI